MTNDNFHSRTALKAGYLRHYARVRSLVPADQLLEFEPGDGWAPLCAFLGKELPPKEMEYHGYEFPAVNGAGIVVKFHEKMWWAALWGVLRKVGAWVSVGAGVGLLGGMWWRV